MDKFKERVILASKILEGSPYDIQKNKIKEVFKNTKNNNLSDILLRLIVIDSCYSTNMNKRFFGFQQLADYLKKLELKIEPPFDVVNFVDTNEYILKDKFGIDKKGNQKGHAFSLISKYLFFRTDFQFPIYDSLVFKGLVNEKLLDKSDKKPSLNYFKALVGLKNKYNISFDDLDKYFWVCGKIENGNISLLLPNAEVYIDFIKKIGSNDIAKEIKSNNIIFDNEKLNLIHKLSKLKCQP